MTAGKTPFFSLLVPTRDRPEFIAYCLQSLKRQSFPDFEVIVCDNHASRPCRREFDEVADERFRYVVPPAPLEMSDNWEFALKHARGTYVGVVIDKTVLLPSALQAAYDATRVTPFEIVSWWSESYYLKDEAAGYDIGTYSPAYQSLPAERFDAATELERRFSLDVRRGSEGRHYFQGKICFGVYHRDLISRIKARAGRLFFPLTPDYTSMLAALAMTNSAVDLGRPYLLSFSSTRSTGASVARDPAFAKNFHMRIDPSAIDNLPLAGLYTSVHNSVAYDYLQTQKRIGGHLDSVSLNRSNLALRAMEDLEQQQWKDEVEKRAQQSILSSYLRQVPPVIRLRHWLSRQRKKAAEIQQSIQFFPTVRRALRPIARRNPRLRKVGKTLLMERSLEGWEHREYFSGIIEAADAADRYYDRHRVNVSSAGASRQSVDKLKILLLCHLPVARNAQTIVDHVRAFRRFSNHDVITVPLISNLGSLPSQLDLDQFDVLVMHYSIVAAFDTYLNAAAKDRISRFGGLKIQFIQDEYRFVDASIATTRRLGIDVLFTCVPEKEVEKVYSSAALPGVRKVSNLTGYVPEGLLQTTVPAIAERPVDVGYRARKLPYWLGALGVEKWRIAEGFLAATRDSGIVCDISSDENSRLYGDSWIRFLTGCKSVLGVESGASVFDFTGEIRRGVDDYVAAHPHASFEDVQARYFAAEEGRILLNQISPRCFEAAALRTAMVLFEGEYSGILQPWRHYIPLRKDFGNIDTVVDHLRNSEFLQGCVDRAYAEVACNPAYSYAQFIKSFDDVVEGEFEKRIASSRVNAARKAGAWHWRVKVPLCVFLFQASQLLVYFIQLSIYWMWMLLPESWRNRIKPLSQSLRARLSTRLRVRS